MTLKDRLVTFSIDHLDPLGQGVCKQHDKIIFIKKTLPGEKGRAEVFKSNKKVSFAVVKTIDQKSPEREEPICPHFDQCNGCHYLHTSYPKEVHFKKETLSTLFEKFSCFNVKDIEFIPAPQRLLYRNRLQLHYDLNKKSLGFKRERSHEIIEVSDCQIPLPEIKNELTKLYQNDFWHSLVPKQAPQHGHLEISFNRNALKLNWNQKYAYHGFTQVNQEMNQLLLEKIRKEYLEISTQLPANGQNLDLFGGNGNLSRQLNDRPIWVIDSHKQRMSEPHQSFIQMNLFENESSNLAAIKQQSIGLMMLDPPRSGFKQLNNWCHELQPQFIFYVSCFPMTLIRDINLLNDNYSLHKVIQMDFFPATFHFETLVILSKRVD